MPPFKSLQDEITCPECPPELGLPKTGQTIEYEPGDDGTYQKGYPLTPPRFTDNGDGTITDMATGLMWAKDGDGAGCNNGNTIIWEDAITYAEALSFAGYDDWRLPNVKELMSIIDFSASDPCLDPVFTNMGWPKVWYWSSTTISFDALSAWKVNFLYGNVNDGDKEQNNYVRLVRGGKP